MPINRLQYLIHTIPEKLLLIPEEDLSYKPLPEKWSKKEIIGHLIDSATNNHHRFVRAQFEEVPKVTYQQDDWNNANHYNNLKSSHIINFWTLYNQHLIEVIKCIPEKDMQREVNTGGDNNITLQWLLQDYVSHMEHHLEQILPLDK